jgi:hypothetical protein
VSNVEGGLPGVRQVEGKRPFFIPSGCLDHAGQAVLRFLKGSHLWDSGYIKEERHKALKETRERAGCLMLFDVQFTNLVE